MSYRNAPKAAAASTAVPAEPLSDIYMAHGMGDLHEAGEADEVVADALRLAAGGARDAPAKESVVLLVDDLEDMRQLGEAMLRQRGFRVVLAADGAEACEKAAALRPDVIVMDFEMPLVNGGDAVRRLAADDRTRSIPVVMVSGTVRRVPREVLSSCAAFLAKPYRPDELGALLHGILAARGNGNATRRASRPSLAVLPEPPK